MKNIYIVGKITTWPAWQIVGVFDDHKKAEGLCIDERFFVGPCELNAPFMDISKNWPGAYRPNRSKSVVMPGPQISNRN